MSEKFYNCLILHANGDAIGFGNGETEFNMGLKQVSAETTNTLIYRLILNGGVTRIDLNHLIVSDDTMLHLATCQALLSDHKNMKEYRANLGVEYVALLKDPFYAKRAYGEATDKSLRLLKSGVSDYKIPYDASVLGNGAAIRAPCLGLAFSGVKNRKKLIAYSVETARITHNSAVGILSSFTVALFTALALEGVDVYRWPFELMQIIDGDDVDEYIKETRPENYNDYYRDKSSFIEAWKNYIHQRIDLREGIKTSKTNTDLKERVRWIFENFHPDRMKLNLKTQDLLKNTGGTGIDGPIFAYDCLVTAIYPTKDVAVIQSGYWESLVYLSMIHVGDSDSVGCMAAAWYGVLQEIKLDDWHSEFPEGAEIASLAKKLYKKFG